MASNQVVNTNKAHAVILGVVMLVGMQSVCLSQGFPKKEIPQVQTAIAHAIVWQWYWRDGKTLPKIRRQISSNPSTPYTLCQVENEDLCAYLDVNQWKVVLTQIGTKHFDFDVVEYRTEADEPSEIRRIYLDELNHEPTIVTKGTLTLRLQDMSVLDFEKPGQEQYGAITNMLIHYLTSPDETEMLKERITADKVHGPLILHIGAFSKQSPWVYYYIEGIPYVGTMLIDPSTGQFVHDDFVYIHENYREAEYKNIVSAIDANGVKFVLNLPAK